MSENSTATVSLGGSQAYQATYAFSASSITTRADNLADSSRVSNQSTTDNLVSAIFCDVRAGITLTIAEERIFTMSESDSESSDPDPIGVNFSSTMNEALSVNFGLTEIKNKSGQLQGSIFQEYQTIEVVSGGNSSSSFDVSDAHTLGAPNAASGTGSICTCVADSNNQYAYQFITDYYAFLNNVTDPDPAPGPGYTYFFSESGVLDGGVSVNLSDTFNVSGDVSLAKMLVVPARTDEGALVGQEPVLFKI